MRSHLRNLFHLIYPRLCYACRQIEPLQEDHLCLECLNILPFVESESDSRAALEGKEWFPKSISFYQTLFYYTKDSKVAEMIHRIKYVGQYRIARYLGGLLGQRLLLTSTWADHVLVPVPIHKKRYRTRGFNQSVEIAKGIASALNIPIVSNHLKRVKYESSQTGKDKYSRSSVLNDSFSINTKQKSPMKIILVDDVITTGSTVNACVNELQKASPEEIAVVSIAISI